MSLRAIKARARRDLHQGMSVPAAYYETAGAAPRPIRVRVHTNWIEQGDLKGTNLNYAERESVAPKLLFDRAEVEMPKRGALVVVYTDAGAATSEGYRVGQAEPPDGFSIKADVTRLSASEAAALPPMEA